MKANNWEIVLSTCRVAINSTITGSLLKLAPRHLPLCGLQWSAYFCHACSTALGGWSVEKMVDIADERPEGVVSSLLSMSLARLPGGLKAKLKGVMAR